MTADVPIHDVRVHAFRVPADEETTDGTAAWDATTMVVAEVDAGGTTGIGYTYGDKSLCALIDGVLAPAVKGCDAFDIPRAWLSMAQALRNPGRPGAGSMAIASVDIALWDLKAKLLGTACANLLGRVRDSIPAYGSGGFTSYDDMALTSQLAEWAEAGMRRVKMKVGREPARDAHRVRVARQAIGDDVELFVDANGAYSRKQALTMAESFAAQSAVTWFEEPVTSDDLEGLRMMRDRAPTGMEIAAGEYGYDATYFRRMLDAGAVDVLQADATRCGGVSGFMVADALCQAHSMPLSAHTAPSVHAHVCLAAQQACHSEYFIDHVRVEGLLLDGCARAHNGRLTVDADRPGLGIELCVADAERYRVAGEARASSMANAALM